MTFRSGESSRSAQPTLKLADLVEASKVEGVVKKIEDYGLFIEIANSKLRGLCHKSEVRHDCQFAETAYSTGYSSLITQKLMLRWRCEASEKVTMSKHLSYL